MAEAKGKEVEGKGTLGPHRPPTRQQPGPQDTADHTLVPGGQRLLPHSHTDTTRYLMGFPPGWPLAGPWAFGFKALESINFV